jgi:hypothetical protein
MCLAETTTPAPKNDSLNGLSSFSLTFFPVRCTLQAVRVCALCLCMVCGVIQQERLVSEPVHQDPCICQGHRSLRA